MPATPDESRTFFMQLRQVAQSLSASNRDAHEPAAGDPQIYAAARDMKVNAKKLLNALHGKYPPGMATVNDDQPLVSGDEETLVVTIKANDPRTIPTEVITLVTPRGDVTLTDLDHVPAEFAKNYGWGLGYEVEVYRRGGGIGASGADVLQLVLGVVSAVPAVLDLYDRFVKEKPTCPDSEWALNEATWAVARAYPKVHRRKLETVSESAADDHRTFQFTLPSTGDRFEVDVYGSTRSAKATHVSWLNGHAWGDRAPGDRR